MRLVGLVTFLVVSSSCATAKPPITPCVFDSEGHKSHCAPHKSLGKPDFELPDAAMDNFTCFSPDDLEALVEWIHRQTNKR